MSDMLPLTAAQRRMWFLHLLRPADPAYNIVIAVEITGTFAPAALAAAISDLVARHSALRTTFHVRAARPVRVTAPAAAQAPVRLTDLTGLGAGQRERALNQLVTAAAARPFDLGRGPVAQWSLVRLAPERHVLVFAAHHIIFDGGSLWVACRELEQGYAAALAGRPEARTGPVPLAPDADQNGLPSDSHDRDLAYWRAHLLGAPPGLAGLRSGRTQSRMAPAACATVVLERDPTRQLRMLAGRNRCTPFMAVLAAAGGLLAAYSGQTELVVGTPVSTRDTPEHWQTIGLFINTLPLRLDFSGVPTFEESMRRVRDVVLDAFTHRAVPFERVVDEVSPHRQIDQTPLFQVLFAYQQSPEPPQLPGTRTRLLPLEPASAMYDLTFLVTDRGDELEIAVQADASQVSFQVTQVVTDLEAVIHRATARPHAPLATMTDVRPWQVPAVVVQAVPPQQRRPPAHRTAARARLEHDIAAVWCEILETADVDPQRSFFDQGGNSLLLLEAHEKLRDRLAPHLTPADLFRFPTVSDLAAFLDSSAGEAVPVAAAATRGARRREAAAGRPGSGAP